MSLEQEFRCRCHSFQNTQTQTSQSSHFFIQEAKPHHSPDRLVDVEHIKLEISVDLKEKLLKGSCSTSVMAVAPEVEKLTFHARDLKIEAVVDDSGSELKFEQTDEKVFVKLRRPLTESEHFKVTFKYSVKEPRAGLYFIQPDKDEPNRPWQLWTQGQDEDNRYWFPCHDSPNEKASTEMIVTVDESYTAISNGRLVHASHDPIGKRRTFHWLQSIPHASYLVTLCVGEFVELKDSWKNSKGEEIPVSYYTLPGRERETKVSFGKTPRMLETFSQKIGVDYPYEKYAQVVAWDFIYGGMENTSSTTQMEYTLHPESVEEDYSSEYLVAHELAHQWFGDLLTCKSWSHAWLNEGFATYFESVWTEHERGKNEQLYELYGFESSYKAEDGGAYRRPVVTNVYLRPSDIFDRHLYEKGARVLHMLRNLVGEDQWWKAVKKYVSTHSASTVETVDLQRAFEEVSGRSLDWFFEQWIFKAGYPDLGTTVSWDEDKKQLKLVVNQKQKVGSLIPLFKFPLKFKTVTAEETQIHSLEITEKEQTFWFSLGKKPLYFSVNPENTILCKLEISTDKGFLINQLKSDEDVMGRIFAAQSLAKNHSREVIDALGEAILSEKFWGAQLETAKVIGSIGSPLCFEYLEKALSTVTHAKARAAVLSAIGNFKNEQSLAIAEKIHREDHSPLVLQAAGIAMGKTRLSGVYEKLSAAFGKRESWHDYYDVGIIQGMAELKSDERVLSFLVKNIKPGRSMFLRRAAVSALAKYAKAKPALVLDTLIDLLNDRNFYVRLYAIAALESLGDDSAAGALRKLSDSSVEPRTARHALLASKSLREGKTASEEVEKVKADFDKLKTQYNELLGRLEKLEKNSSSEKVLK